MKAFWNNHGFTRMSFAYARSCLGSASPERSNLQKGQALAPTIRVIRGSKLMALTIALFSMGPVVAASATTPEFRLSIKHDGIRASAGEEMLRYSPIWDGGSNETAKVTLKQGDMVITPIAGRKTTSSFVLYLRCGIVSAEIAHAPKCLSAIDFRRRQLI